jgi:phage antirepressor YoqD-like protein
MAEAIEKAGEDIEITTEQLQAKYPDWDAMSDFEKEIAKDSMTNSKRLDAIREATKDFKEMDVWNGKVDKFMSDPETLTIHPDLEGKEEEFIYNYFDSLDDDVKKSLTANLARNNHKLKEQLKEQAPKIEHYEKVIDSTGTFTTTEVAKLLGISSARTLNEMLVKQKVQYKAVDGNLYLYANYQGKGYVDFKTHVHKSFLGFKTTHQMRWTEKGIEFIADVLFGYSKESLKQLKGGK